MDFNPSDINGYLEQLGYASSNPPTKSGEFMYCPKATFFLETGKYTYTEFGHGVQTLELELPSLSANEVSWISMWLPLTFRTNRAIPGYVSILGDDDSIEWNMMCYLYPFKIRTENGFFIRACCCQLNERYNGSLGKFRITFQWAGNQLTHIAPDGYWEHKKAELEGHRQVPEIPAPKD